MTQTFKTLDDITALATFAHRNQSDKAGDPYINHPLRVLAAVQQQGARPYEQMAAVLHDVTEDTAFTCDMLIALGVPEAAVNIVRLVDRNASLNAWRMLYEQPDLNSFPTAKEFYYFNIRADPGALKVKLADIGDNLQPWRLSYLSEPTQERLRAKYAEALLLLTGTEVLA